MFNSKQRSWLVVDLGGRWVKCARYQVKRGALEMSGSQVIDIQEEGLLSIEEIAAAVGRLFREAGDTSVAVVLPQASVVSQVVDLPELSAGGLSTDFDQEIRELTGLSAERCVYDCSGLEPFGGYAGPQWITVAKEATLSRSIAPLLGQGLRVEAVTTTGNALVAAFRRSHPEAREAFLVDIGATQTTLVELRRGDPVHMVSLVGGGEAWVETLVGMSGDAFEETEASLFRDHLIDDPARGPALRSAVADWRDGVMRQVKEWREDSALSSGEKGKATPLYVFGGYARVQGLAKALEDGNGVRYIFEGDSDTPSRAVWQSCLGAAAMAAGQSELSASILPRSLEKVRQRRQRLARLKLASLYVLIAVAAFLSFAIAQQQSRLDTLQAASARAEQALEEIEASERLLETRDELASRIDPMVRRQLESIEALETFRRLQKVHRGLEFTLVRFVDRESYDRGLTEATPGGRAVNGSGDERSGNPPKSDGSHAFVAELSVQGGQAERLQALGEIVDRLRSEHYFTNVDRLVREPTAVEAAGSGDTDQTYALLLTLDAQAGEATASEAMEGERP